MSLSSAARFRYTLVGGATAVVIGAGFTAVGLDQHGKDTAVVRAADDAATTAAPNGPGGAILPDPGASSGPSSAPTIAPSSAAPSSAAPRASTKAPVRSRTRATAKPSHTSGGSAPTTGSAILSAVLEHINAARARAGLSPYTFSSALSRASAKHNQLMIDGCGLQHQCPGESGIGDRFSAQGVSWTAAGENIGVGSSGSSDAAIIQAANGLTDRMLAETPPNDGHRKNLLSGTFKRIGLSVVRDGKGNTWMTQDFVN